MFKPSSVLKIEKTEIKNFVYKATGTEVTLSFSLNLGNEKDLRAFEALLTQALVDVKAEIAAKQI